MRGLNIKMRNEFFKLLHEAMAKNKEIYFLTGDLGFGLCDRIRNDYSDRFINVGAAEQTLLDISVGLALEGKMPFAYSITPFLIYRPFEALRTYVNHEFINIKLIGSGRDDDYIHDGFSHNAGDIYHFMDGFPNIAKYYPEDIHELSTQFVSMLESENPGFLSLTR